MKKSVTLIVFAAATLLSARAKLIKIGWDEPDAQFLRQNIAAVEKALPFDGISIGLPRKMKNGKLDVSYGHLVFKNEKFPADLLDQWVADLKNTKFTRLTDNFASFAVTNANYDVFDDAAWSSALHNVKIVARAAKKAGLKGLRFDIEHYNYGKPMIFQYSEQSKKSFDEAAAKARQRGKEFAAAVAGEFPDAVILTVLGSFSVSHLVLDSADRKAAAESSQYGLSSMFFDGLLSGMTPQMRLLDGFEIIGYSAADTEAVFQINRDHQIKSPQLVSPENLTKFHRQTSPAPGLFLDCYVNEKGFYVFDKPGIDKLALLRRNLVTALESFPEYVWLYSEQCRWHEIELPPVVDNAMQKASPNARLWEERMPGVTQTVEFVRNPRKFQNQGTLVYSNHFDDEKLSSVTVATGKLLKGLSCSSSVKGGKVEFDPAGGINKSNALKFTAVRWGGAHRVVPVKPGEVYFLKVFIRKDGDAMASLTTTFRDQQNREMSAYNQKIFPSGTSVDGFREASQTVIIPDRAKSLIVSLGCASATGNATVWVDNLEIRKLFND